MRGIYFLCVDCSEPKSLGIYKKVEGQIKALNSLGAEVKHVYFSSGELLFDGRKVATYRNKIHKKLDYRRASIQIAKEYRPDFVLIRYVFPTHMGTLIFLKQLRRQGAIVVLEVPTYPYDKEVKGDTAKMLALLIDKFFRNFLRNHVHLVITPSNTVQSIFEIKTLSISNGMDLSCFPKKSKADLATEVFNLIGVANVNFWHGYDRIVKGLADYYRTQYSPKVYFHVVGHGEALEDLKKMASSLGVKEYVIFHGPKTG